MPGQPGRVIWCLSGSGLGTTIAGNGNSGGWVTPGPPPWSPDWETTVDLRYVDDIVLLVSVGGIVTTPTLKVQLDVYDDLGNLFPAVAATGNIVAGGSAPPVYVGRHGGTTGLFAVLPAWGRVSWTCSGGSCTGVEIALYGR